MLAEGEQGAVAGVMEMEEGPESTGFPSPSWCHLARAKTLELSTPLKPLLPSVVTFLLHASCLSIDVSRSHREEKEKLRHLVRVHCLIKDHYNPWPAAHRAPGRALCDALV